MDATNRSAHVPALAIMTVSLLVGPASVECGVVFISLMGLLLSPIAHRVLHKFHLSDEDMNDKKSPKSADSRKQGTH